MWRCHSSWGFYADFLHKQRRAVEITRSPSEGPTQWPGWGPQSSQSFFGWARRPPLCLRVAVLNLVLSTNRICTRPKSNFPIKSISNLTAGYISVLVQFGFQPEPWRVEFVNWGTAVFAGSHRLSDLRHYQAWSSIKILLALQSHNTRSPPSLPEFLRIWRRKGKNTLIFSVCCLPLRVTALVS